MTCTGSTNRSRGRELAAPAAAFVRVIADGVVLEFASRRVAALVIPTTTSATTITVFSSLDNAIAALITGDGSNAFVDGQARGLDAVSADSRTNIAYRARAELGNALTCRRVHDVLSTRVTG